MTLTLLSLLIVIFLVSVCNKSPVYLKTGTEGAIEVTLLCMIKTLKNFRLGWLQIDFLGRKRTLPFSLPEVKYFKHCLLVHRSVKAKQGGCPIC